MSLAVLAALLLSAAAAPPPEARDLKEAGDRKRAVGDAPGAIEAYEAAVALFGDYAEAYRAAGEVLASQNFHLEAALAFERAVEIEPGLERAWYDLADSARHLGDLTRARDAWRRYLALRPDDLDARFGLAESLRGLGEREKAIEAFETYLGLALPIPREARRVEEARQALAALRAEATRPAPVAPSTPTATSAPTATAQPMIVVPVPAPIPVPSSAAPPTGAGPSGRQALARQKLRLGDQVLAEGDTRLALFAYQDAVNQDPQSAEARLKLGRVYLLLGHPDEAQEQFGVAAALEPGNAEARQALEEARARQQGAAPPPGSPIIVRLPPGGEVEPGPGPLPASPAPRP